MFIKIIWYDVFERKTLECIVADGNAAWSICHALDQCDTVRQWRLDVPEDTFIWYHSNNSWDKLKIDPNKWDYS
jgi:hypothetical protein